MTLTGQDIHEAYCLVERSGKPWDAISAEAKQRYEEMAVELNRVVESQQITIDAIKCDICHEMVPVSVYRWHLCFAQ